MFKNGAWTEFQEVVTPQQVRCQNGPIRGGHFGLVEDWKVN